ncbi:PhoD-like phosphatase N-terminal domain-containing protein [Bacillus sonorensis]|nr:PhoD-like phosphatase N-terminal domain-containing protein [Bacillus sonorensis]
MKINVSESFHEKTAGIRTAESDGRTAAEKVPRFTAYPFTLGVSSGEPLPDSVVLWTRLAPEPLNGGACLRKM